MHRRAVVTRRRTDDLEKAIENALAPGVFIGYRQTWDFVERLEAVHARIASLIEKDEARRAVTLLETFIAGCYEKSAEIDDSSGNFGMLVESLFCDWIRARQAAGAEPAETVRMLMSWMENDDYGYCHRLEREAVKVLDRAGLGAFERAVRDRPKGGGKEAYAHHRKIEILKAIYEARRDVAAYAALCEEEGVLAPSDCELLAQMCLKRRRPPDALAWVERGLDLEKEGTWRSGSSWRLPQLHREILRKLGRSRDALASAWEEYERAPSVFSYEDLMKCAPRSERGAWHTRAITALDGADLPSRIQLLLQTREWSRLAGVIDSASRSELVALSHYTTEPVAKKLVKSHPLLAAKLHIAQALRILEAKKSKYYDAALGNLEKARKLLLREGKASEWEALVAEIRNEHRRKSSFMPGFRRLAEGRSLREPSFRERAQRRWRQGSSGRRRRG